MIVKSLFSKVFYEQAFLKRQKSMIEKPYSVYLIEISSFTDQSFGKEIKTERDEEHLSQFFLFSIRA
ncbi:hypothetical protein BCR25_15550 [Enterococcus termitis]|uniref:Uncharacterized protein n=1 Tax=Enterococcus termitis TaxID=332950 RepID=A0A1E5H1Y4_9ENTE|nr:hypothetical protein BCR25_15550 [Enterococcus termitis]